MSERTGPWREGPDLGVRATVFADRETHGPTCLYDDTDGDLREIDVEKADGMLVWDIDIVSTWTLQVALYALQQGTPEARERALYLIGTSGDVEEHTDHETLLPLPVEKPHGWDDQI